MTQERRGYEIRSVDRPQADEALHVLLSALPADEQAIQRTLLHTILDDASRRDSLILLGAVDDRGLFGVILGEILAGNNANIWPPRCVQEEDDAPALELIRCLQDALRSRGVVTAQALLASGDGEDAEHLVAGGFAPAAELLYMVAFTSENLAAETSLLDFKPVEDDERLMRILEATYRDSLDCPLIDGMRSLADVLAGYRAMGQHRPELWRIIRKGGDDVGCLLLTDYPPQEQWELVYLGIVPTFRGFGYGGVAANWAICNARAANRARVLLAVDAANAPGIRIYRQAGFREWDRRAVFICNLKATIL